MQIEHIRAISRWHLGHRGLKPVEFIVWRAIVAAWAAGWVGVFAGLVMHAAGLACVGALILAMPELYGRWRRALDRRALVRCDWADSMPPLPVRRKPRRRARTKVRWTLRWCAQHAFALVLAAMLGLLLIVAGTYTHLLEGAITTPLLELEIGL